MAKQLSVQEALVAAARLIAQRKLYNHKPYDWQQRFHDAGKENHERLLMAANAVGKTVTGGFETSVHLTGEYPENWQGHRFDHPPTFWIGSISNGAQVEYTQPMLLGPDLGEGLGTGFIPKKLLVGKPTPRQAGISGVADTFRVRHRSGGVAKGVFKTYEQGWRMWQGGDPDGIWLDEQPDDNAANEKGIFAEVQTRLLRTNGILLMTLTPLLGETETIEHFTKPQARGIFWMNARMNREDAPHLNQDRIDALVATYLPHQLDARTKGIPMLGEGAIFPVAESSIICDPIEVPPHFFQICGVDFGTGHPFGWARMAYDRGGDVAYVVDCWRAADQTPPLHIAAIRGRAGFWLPPHAWPHDGMNREKSGGKELHKYYRGVGLSTGLPMLGHSAHYKPRGGEKPKLGPQDQEPIILDILTRMQTGRWKVFKTCQPWLEEFRSYHRKEDKPVPIRDDVLKASFYAHMMKRYAAQPSSGIVRHRPAQRPALSAAL